VAESTNRRGLLRSFGVQVRKTALEVGPLPGLGLGGLIGADRAADAAPAGSPPSMTVARAKELALAEGFGMSWRKIEPLLEWGVVADLEPGTAELRLDPVQVAAALAAHRTLVEVDTQILVFAIGPEGVAVRTLGGARKAVPIVDLRPELLLPADDTAEYGALRLPPARAAAWRRLRHALRLAQIPSPVSTGQRLSIWLAGPHLSAEALRPSVDPL
jgi:hypothetical protein